jgi:NADH-quinone oxidoreductase subunit M
MTLLLFLLPIVTLIGVWFTKDKTQAKTLALWGTVLTFVWTLVLFLLFDSTSSNVQFTFTTLLGMDGISLWFLVLTAFLIPIAILSGWDSIYVEEREYLTTILGLELILFVVFLAQDILLFYVSYEASLIPMFLIIGKWGGRIQKVKAAYYFFFYTLLASMLMLVALIYIYTITGTTHLSIISHWPFDEHVQLYLWFAFFASLAVKIPMFPAHLWLPQAHVEAPLGGSVLLAGILLKLGGYGFLRFLLPLFPQATHYFSPLVVLLSIIAIIYGSLTTLVQTDMKRLIAYSSIAHMGNVTLGIFTLNSEGIQGSIILMIAHGLISSGLFILVTTLYDRHHTRLIKYYRGMAVTMPLFATFFFLLSLSSMGTPPTSNFIGEFLCLLGIYQSSFWASLLAGTGIVLSAAYTLFFFNRITFGTFSPYLVG